MKYIEGRYGKRFAGDGTLGRRVRELVQEGLLIRRAPGIFAITKSQVQNEVRTMREKQTKFGKLREAILRDDSGWQEWVLRHDLAILFVLMALTFIVGGILTNWEGLKGWWLR